MIKSINENLDDSTVASLNRAIGKIDGLTCREALNFIAGAVKYDSPELTVALDTILKKTKDTDAKYSKF